MRFFNLWCENKSQCQQNDPFFYFLMLMVWSFYSFFHGFSWFWSKNSWFFRCFFAKFMVFSWLFFENHKKKE
jgi:hypothetical protein